MLTDCSGQTTEGRICWDTDDDKFYVGDGTTVVEISGGGSGDITAVGDVASGAAFNGTQGTTLTFNNAGGDATLQYDGSDFLASHDLVVQAAAPNVLLDPTSGNGIGLHCDPSSSTCFVGRQGGNPLHIWGGDGNTYVPNVSNWRFKGFDNLTLTGFVPSIDQGTGAGGIKLDGSGGGCLMLRDTDDAGWSECCALDGTLTCGVDANGVIDGSP